MNRTSWREGKYERHGQLGKFYREGLQIYYVLWMPCQVKHAFRISEMKKPFLLSCSTFLRAVLRSSMTRLERARRKLSFRVKAWKSFRTRKLPRWMLRKVASLKLTLKDLMRQRTLNRYYLRIVFQIHGEVLGNIHFNKKFLKKFFKSREVEVVFKTISILCSQSSKF